MNRQTVGGNHNGQAGASIHTTNIGNHDKTGAGCEAAHKIISRKVDKLETQHKITISVLVTILLLQSVFTVGMVVAYHEMDNIAAQSLEKAKSQLSEQAKEMQHAIATGFKNHEKYNEVWIAGVMARSKDSRKDIEQHILDEIHKASESDRDWYKEIIKERITLIQDKQINSLIKYFDGLDKKETGCGS